MMTAEIHAGVDRLLVDYAVLEPDDTVVVAYTMDCRSAATWVVSELRSRSHTPILIPMRPLVDHDLWARLDDNIPTVVSNRLLVFTLEAETMSHFGQFESIMNRYHPGRCQIVRLINAGSDLFTMGLTPTPSDLLQRNATLLHHLMGRSHVRVRSSGGTDLRIELDPRYDWISNSGTNRPGVFTVLPAGEIATFPARVDGTFVVDGAVHCNVITRFDTRTADDPIRIDITDSTATTVTGGSTVVRDLIDACFRRRHGRRIGELGFGTNLGVNHFVADNSHVNERRPSVHLGFGQHNQTRALVPYEEEVHLDLISNDSQLHFDDGTTIDLATFDVLDVEHPPVRTDDITGDCCSFGNGNLHVEAL